MAALQLRTSCSCWCPPAARGVRPIRGALHVLPSGRRGPLSEPVRTISPAPVTIVQAHHRRNAFRPQCHKGADQHAEPEPEDATGPDAAQSSENQVCRILHEIREAVRAANGRREAPDLFLKEKHVISDYMLKIASSIADILNVNKKVMALTVCAQVQATLDLASKDMSSIEMVRMYTPIFCNAAEDAFHKRIKMDTILSFVDALRCLGAIFHIVVQQTVAKLEDDPLRNSIFCRMETHSHEFDKRLNNLKDEFIMASEIKHTIVMAILLDGIKSAQSYIFQLTERHRDALFVLIDGQIKYR
ncbi:hypothetical protein ACP4OV_030328 [Aristida adscensionis]